MLYNGKDETIGRLYLKGWMRGRWEAALFIPDDYTTKDDIANTPIVWISHQSGAYYALARWSYTKIKCTIGMKNDKYVVDIKDVFSNGKWMYI